MKKVFVLCTACLLSFVAYCQQPSKDDLQKKEADLRKEINELTNTLVQIQKNKRATVAQIAAVQRKIAAREELINNIYRQVRLLDETIYQNELEIYRMRKELDTLKQKYAQSIVFAYKNRSNYQYLNFLFSSSSFNDALKRVTYLKSYRQLRETQVGTIVKTQQVLQEKIGTLTSSKNEQSKVLETHKTELRVLEDDKKEKDVMAKGLKGKEKEVTALITKKNKQRLEMSNAIAAVIRREQAEALRLERIAREKRLAEEKAKRDAEIANAKKNAANNSSITNNAAPAKPNITAPKKITNEPLTPMPNSGNGGTRDYSTFEATEEGVTLSKKFEEKNLPWPVSIGTVVIPFGTYSAGGKLTGVSDGIEIAVPEGTSVKSVADGKVSYVGDLGGEMVVMVKHGKYFTTYGHLSSVLVSKDQEVKAGTILGKSGTGTDGDGALLFMVTNDKKIHLNPKNWLRAR